MADSSFNFKELASKKVGGIPVIWIVAVVALAALYGAIRLKPAPDPGDDDIPEGDAPEAEGDGIDTDQPVFSATPVIYQPSGGSVSSTPMEDTNELWGRRAVEWLVANGFTLTVASNAITKYLAGDILSTTEGDARDKAVAHYGLPPEGLLPTSTTTFQAPASKQGTPPTVHTVKSAKDNQPAELARIYYGLTTADAVNFIKAANTRAVVPYAVGTRVTIPKWHSPTYYTATTAVNTLYAIARKNGTNAATVQALNPGKTFPVKSGIRVRVS